MALVVCGGHQEKKKLYSLKREPGCHSSLITDTFGKLIKTITEKYTTFAEKITKLIITAPDPLFQFVVHEFLLNK